MSDKMNDDVRNGVRDAYSKVAEIGNAQGCGCAPSSCCGDGDVQLVDAFAVSSKLGYSAEEIAAAPEGANMGLGCGNPQTIASLKPGETVIDLGSGGGFDAFIASRHVGENGRVIGVDMTPEMISKARANKEKTGAMNVEFRLGEIEYLPVPDNTADVIMSNCVINLSPDKPAVFRDAYRALKPGGRLAISDVVASADIPDELKADMALLSGCMSGAERIDRLLEMIEAAGFHDVAIEPKDESREFIREWAPGHGIEDLVVSANITGRKPS